MSSSSRCLLLFLLIALPAGVVLTQSGQNVPQDQNWNRRPPGAGDYQIVLEVSGRVEVSRNFKMSDPLDLRSICAAKQEAEHHAFVSAESYLSSLQKAGDTRPFQLEMASLHNELGQLYAYRGEMGKAVEQFDSAYQILISNLGRHPEFAGDKPYFEEILGIANLRSGEVDNCLHNHNAETCIFPLSAAARHRITAGAEKSIEYFKRHLAQKPDNLEVRWLLNLAYMALGKYPQAVPPDFLIPPAAFASKDRFAKFTDVAASLGVDVVSGAGGAIMDDFDNDGFLDLVISSVDACQSLRYFHNKGDGTFADWTEKAKLTDQIGGINCVQTDYNNDGWLDIFVMRGGWEFPMRNSLLRNNGDGTFTDVTKESGLLSGEHRTHTAAWADFDNDGWLDVFVGHEETPSQLFRNNGDGTFTDVTPRAGVGRTAFTKGATWGDYDNDGYPDLYVSNYGGENFLYHNNGDGTFTEVGKQLGVERPLMSFPTWFCDYDNDGWLDIFVSCFVPSVAEVAAGYLGLPARAETMKLYRNTGDGKFQDVTKKVGLDRVLPAMGANFGDLDNDGFLDFYIGTGAPSYAALVPNFVFRNKAGLSFADVTAASGMGHLQKGHGVAIGDLDNDGDADVFVNIGGFLPGDQYNKALFENPANGRGKAESNNWIAIRLVGVKTNRAAIGAKIRLTLADAGGRKSLRYREVTSGGSFGASSLAQEIGLGKAKQIETLEIIWPVSRTRQIFHNLGANQFIEVKELAGEYQIRRLNSFVMKRKEGSPESQAPHDHNRLQAPSASPRAASGRRARP
ncbi:MAG TPA: FG-GAP-like repeat-containing protein [Blastocatellia bacterium]|nr:FG-GAP-like repeat-containing protein [Blastocatellia bacterium]